MHLPRKLLIEMWREKHRGKPAGTIDRRADYQAGLDQILLSQKRQGL